MTVVRSAVPDLLSALGDLPQMRRLAATGLVRFCVALAREIADDDVPGMAAEMAYRFLFALFPLAVLTAVILGIVEIAFGLEELALGLVERVAPFVPAAVALETIVTSVATDRAGAYATIALLATLWGAAGGIGVLIKGLNRAYDVERPRRTWHRQALAMGATPTVPPLGLALLVLSAVGHSLTTWLGAALGVGATIARALAALQATITIAVFLVSMSVVYWTLPAVRQRYRDVLPGSLVAAIGWAVLTQAFGVYVANLGRYEATYGAFGAAIAFLLWLYLVGVVVLVGAEVNALLSPSGRPSWAGPRGPRTEMEVT